MAGLRDRIMAGLAATRWPRLTSTWPQLTPTRPRLAATAAGATAATALVVTAMTLTVVSLSPAPGHGATGWMALEVDVITPPAEPAPLSRLDHRLGTGPVDSPAPGPVTQPAGEFIGWAILDRRTGNIVGSATMTEVSTTASLIKAWIVADYLRLAAEAGRRPGNARMEELELTIRDSHNGYAETIFKELGASESIQRLIRICELTDSRAYRDFWSNTQLSPRDTARLGACIADGRAAGPEWTDWLLEQMQAVRGAGDFGIRHAFPEPDRSGIAIKNGWIDRDYDLHWHVNCLAIGETWTMGVMVRFPVELGYAHGARLCQSLAEEHLLPLVTPAA